MVSNAAIIITGDERSNHSWSSGASLSSMLFPSRPDTARIEDLLSSMNVGHCAQPHAVLLVYAMCAPAVSLRTAQSSQAPSDGRITSSRWPSPNTNMTFPVPAYPRMRLLSPVPDFTTIRAGCQPNCLADCATFTCIYESLKIRFNQRSRHSTPVHPLSRTRAGLGGCYLRVDRVDSSAPGMQAPNPRVIAEVRLGTKFLFTTTALG